MKMILKNLTSLVFLATLGMTVFVGSAQCADEALPPEVQSLIGMKIQSEKQGEFGRIKNWESKGWSTLNIFPKPNQTMGVEELYQGDMSIFVIELMDKSDWSMTILDAQVLPRQMLNYSVKNGKIVWKKSLRTYRFESGCYRKTNPKERIVGLIRPENGKEDCTHETKQVKRAWKIDQESGHVSETLSDRVLCYFMDAEFSCAPL